MEEEDEESDEGVGEGAVVEAKDDRSGEIEADGGELER
jgi:hypothetical protein